MPLLQQLIVAVTRYDASARARTASMAYTGIAPQPCRACKTGSTTKCHAAQAAQGKLAGSGRGLNWGRYHESCPDTGTVADTHAQPTVKHKDLQPKNCA